MSHWTWVSMHEMQEEIDFPYKVLLAKCRQMINKGRLKGCGCGCRGDFELPEPTPSQGGWGQTGFTDRRD